jgi:hypothetical protein
MLPARRTDPAHDQALTAALDRLTGGVPDRADTPDAWITAVRRLAPLDARYAPFGDLIDARLCDVLRQRGVDQLYTHQALVIEHALAGRHVVVTTPTASGKTLCYNAPVLSTILRDPSARALYLFPTKALAQDQLAELHELSDLLSRRNPGPPVPLIVFFMRKKSVKGCGSLWKPFCGFQGAVGAFCASTVRQLPQPAAMHRGSSTFRKELGCLAGSASGSLRTKRRRRICAPAR